MVFVDRAVIESFNFGPKEPITIIAPELRQTRPVIHSLEAALGKNGNAIGFLFSKTKAQLERWDFPQEPGFYIRCTSGTYICTKVRYLNGLNYLLCDAVPISEDIVIAVCPEKILQYLPESEVDSYHFGPKEPVILRTPFSKTPSTSTRLVLASEGDSGENHAFMLDKTNSQMKRLCFPQIPGFTIKRDSDSKEFVCTRIRYAPSRNYLICDVRPV